MSDQDFFFDDEDAPKADASSSKSASSKPSAKSGSSAPASKSGTSKPASAGKPSGAAPVKGSDADGQMFEKNVSLAVAAMLMVIALLVGVIIGIFVGQAMSSGTAQTPAATTADPAMPSSGGAGVLTEEQMSGGLPEGHPEVGDTGTAASATVEP